MRSFSFLLALILAFATASYALPSTDFPALEVRKEGKGNGTQSANPEKALKQTCKKMRNLNAVSMLAANQTKLDSWVAAGKLDQAGVDALKAKAATATTELKTMQSNTTLVTECAAVDAERKSVSQCMQMKQLTKLATLAGNATALAAFEQKKKMNDTQIEMFKTKIADAPAKLKEMMSNTTLTTFCTQRQADNKDEKTGKRSYILLNCRSRLLTFESDSAAQGDSTTTQAQQQSGSKSGAAASVSAQALPFVLVPALASVFVLFL